MWPRGESRTDGPDPELVRGCGDCLELVAEDLSDRNTHMGRCLRCNQEIHAKGGSRLATGGPEPLPALRQTGVVKR